MKLQIGEITIQCDSSEEAIKIIKGLGGKKMSEVTSMPTPQKPVRQKKNYLRKNKWTAETLTVIYQNKHLAPSVLKQLPQLRMYSIQAINKATWALRRIKKGDTSPHKEISSLMREVFTGLINVSSNPNWSRPVDRPVGGAELLPSIN